MAKRLSDKEIRLGIEKLKEEYNHFIVRYEQSLEAKNRFEERLRQAELKRFDMGFFLGAELKTLRELIRETEELKHRAAQESHKKSKKTVQGKSYADRVLEKLQAQLEPYPGLVIHPEASFDLEKLYGTINWIQDTFWTPLRRIALEKGGEKRVRSLDEEFEKRRAPRPGELPRELRHYHEMLDRPGVALIQVNREQNRLIQEASFFIHDFTDLVRELRGLCSGRQREAFLAQALGICDKLIQDFRLKDLKRK